MPVKKVRTTSSAFLVAFFVAALSSLSPNVGFADAPPKVARRTFKPARDPEKPKRPASPWLQFAVQYRKENPDLGKDTLKSASVAWKSVDAATRRGFEEKYEKARETYTKELAAYKASGKEEAWLRPAGKPKQPMSAYLSYVQEQWKQAAGSMSMFENAKKAAAEWRSMSASQKAPYQAQYEKAKAEFNAAMEKFKASGAQEAWERKVGIAQQKEKIEAKIAKAKAKVEAEKAKIKAAKAKAKAKAEAEKAKAAKAKAKAKAKAQAEKAKAKAKAKSKAKAKAKSRTR